MEAVMERECSALGGLFQTIMADMKSSYPVWDDFISKAGKLQTQLRTTVVLVTTFLDAFQKVADLATNSRGGTRDIGSSLTRMCMRHRSIEAKLRHFSVVFLDCLINPLQDQMEEWKRSANTLDKDHAKEYKKSRQEIKKRSSDTLKLQKKAKKADVYGRGDLQPQLDSALQGVSDKLLLLEETEKQAVRRALLEERGRFCCFVSMLRPVVEEEMSLLRETSHLHALTEDLKALTMDPHRLPPSSEQVIVDLKGSDCTWSFQTPPSSPSTSRKSSMCSSLNSVNSSDSRSSSSHSPSSSSHFRGRASSSSSSLLLPLQTPARLSSVSSHDSGFTSSSKSPEPCQDWSKPAMRRSRTADPISHLGCDVTAEGEEPQSIRGGHALPTTKENMEVHQELLRVLSRGLQLDLQGSSRDSVQGSTSSGYSSQNNTPCCSEDAMTTQVLDCEYYSVAVDQDGEHQHQQQQHQHHDSDKSSTVPRNSDLTHSYRRMFQSKRPASTAGLPSNPSAGTTPGVATIRRTPSSKPNLRRPAGGLSLGPIPIRPPMIPVKTPTVPDMPGFPSRAASVDSSSPRTPLTPPTTPLSPGSTGLLLSAKSDPSYAQHRYEATSDPPTPPPQPGRRASELDHRPLPELLEEVEVEFSEVEDYLVAIRRGVKLKKTTTNDRSAPYVH